VALFQNRAKLEAQELDYEKPGLAQHYCVECAKFVFSIRNSTLMLTIGYIH
jgi:hypothetical protein